MGVDRRHFAHGGRPALAAIYAVATICGFIYAHIPVIALVSATDADNYLQLITGLTAILVALVSAGKTSHRPAGSLHRSEVRFDGPAVGGGEAGSARMVPSNHFAASHDGRP